MSLAGTGAVAIWHDLLPDATEDFYEWHNREHMRVGIPGFRRGRRYIAVEGAPKYFNLYEADSPEVLSGGDCLNGLNAPQTGPSGSCPRSVGQHAGVAKGSEARRHRELSLARSAAHVGQAGSCRMERRCTIFRRWAAGSRHQWFAAMRISPCQPCKARAGGREAARGHKFGTTQSRARW
jgi:hypothetical protein